MFHRKIATASAAAAATRKFPRAEASPPGNTEPQEATPPPSIIPALPPAPPTVNWTSTVLVHDQTYTVASGSYLSSTSDVSMISGSRYYYAPLVNEGTLWMDGSIDPNLYSPHWTYFIADGVNVVNRGLAVSLARWASNVGQSDAIAFTYFYKLENSGQIYAWAEAGRAFALWSETYPAITNSGLIAAFVESGLATAIVLENGGAIVNEAGGRILAEGPVATAISYYNANLPSGWPDNIHVNNAGLIQAASTNVNIASVGIRLVHADHQTARVVNSGVITAEIAIADQSSEEGNYSPVQASAQIVENLAGGTINGDIILNRGDDVVENDGTINGFILLGEGDDVFDSVDGSYSGLVDLGWGADTFRGSAAVDLVPGSSGDDSVEGNDGNDLLLGGADNDILAGGAGNDGLFGEYGNDRIVTLGGDFVWGGPGEDLIEAGDFAFELIDGNEGFDTLVLPAGARAIDLSTVVAQQAVFGIEKIVLGGDKTIVVRAADIPAIAGGATTLRIEGAASDRIDLVGSWAGGGTVAIDGVEYRSYQLDGKTVLIEGAANAVANATPPAAGGLDPVPAVGLAPLPGEGPIDFTPNESFLVGYTLTQSVTVSAEQTWWNDLGQPILYSSSHSPDITLTNHGWLLSYYESFGYVGLLGLTSVGLLDNYGAITAASTWDGQVYDEEQAFSVTAASHGNRIVNHGLIEAVTVHGLAVAVWETDFLVNHSDIVASSEHGYATGFLDGYSVENYGTISVTGALGAVGAYLGLYEMSNDGRIEATTTSDFGDDSIGLHFSLGAAVPAAFTNRGVILADIAVRVVGAADMTLTNQGTLSGRIELDVGADRIVNTGSIGGAIHMGDGNDLFDGSGGTQAGLIEGGGGDDTLIGSSGSDLLAGGAGIDILRGGAGADRFAFLAATDSIASAMDRLDDFQPGVDRIDLRWLGQPAFSWTEHVDSADGSLYSIVTVTTPGGPLVFRVDSRLTAADFLLRQPVLGTAGRDALVGTEAPDVLRGLDGSDQLQGLDSADELDGGAGNDTLAGGADADRLIGGIGNDILDGGKGGDRMEGGAGDDVYFYDDGDDIYVDGDEYDTIIEKPGEGIDTVRSSVDYALAAELENGILIGSARYLSGNDLANMLVGNGQNNTLQGGAGDDFLDGGDGIDSLGGGAGNDIYIVGEGDHPYEENPFDTGVDEVRTALATYSLPVGFEILTGTSSTGQALTGNGFNNIISGGAGNDVLTGFNGDDVLDGGAGADTMAGEIHNDTYVVDHVGDQVVEAPGEGIDTVRSAINHMLGANVENLILTGTAINGSGNALANSLTGNAAANRLDGGGGGDSMAGGLGNDVYVVDHAGDTVTEGFGAGIDSVESSVSHSLAANVESLALTGAAAIDGSGNDLANVLTGNSAANRLDGGLGADTLAGGLGNDTYVVDSAGDVIAEAAGAGTDTVEASIVYSLGSNLENLTLIGTAAIDGTGNALANTLTGNGAANRLDGKAGADAMAGGLGNDTYVVDHAGDAVTEAAGEGTDGVESSVTFTLGANVENLVLTGSAAINGTGNGLANSLTGNAAANRLDGSVGADVMSGGAGDDIYVVDNASDQAVELSGQGKDLVRSGVSFTLGANVEKLALTGTAAINGTGNGLGNAITGNSAANTLDGGLGADAMAGGAGNDTYLVDHLGDRVAENANEGSDTVRSSVTFSLTANIETLVLTGTAAVNATGNSAANTITGNAAANLINGGGGADAMAGGNGNDIYIVETVGDVVTEAANEGTDLVKSSISFTLGANVEKLTLRGSSAIDGTGNALANTIAGNEAANRLDGGAGADKLMGAGGNDTYIVDHIADQVIEASSGGGSDTVLSSVTFSLGDHVESLHLTGASAIDGNGNDLANFILGNAAANRLDGGRGNDALSGGGGDDILLGGLGLDRLEGGAGADDFVFDKPLGAGNVDTILDFSRGSDDIVLENAVFKGLAAGALSASALRIGSAAADADDRIVYDPATGNLYYDADGSGAAAQILFATLDTAPATLSASDFAVI